MINDQDLVLRRYTQSWETGRAVLAQTDMTLRGSIQPASGELLEEIGAGKRSRSVLVLRTQDDAQTSDPDGGGKVADIVVVETRQYQIHEVRPWMSMLGYREVILVRVDESAVAGAA